MTSGEAAAAFLPHRHRLQGLAYRMLGSVSEAEDVVQEAFLRWQAAEREEVAEPGAFLSRIVTRLCLDQLKSARHRREHYVGAWLPEPLVEPPAQERVPGELEQDLSNALLLALERLSPLERAVFLLHDVFDTGFPEVAAALGRSEAACRQLAVRARAHVRAARPRFNVPPAEGEAIALAFFQASRAGDLKQLTALLAGDVELISDGGGRRIAALNPIRGRAKVCRFLEGVARKAEAPPASVRFAWINGSPGLVTVEYDGLPQSVALEVDADGRIRTIYVVRNPEKLAHLQSA